MHVDEHVDAVFIGLGDDLLEVVEVVQIVFAAGVGLDRFPGRQQAQAVEAHVAQDFKIPVRLFQREGLADVGDRIVGGGELGRAAHIRAVQKEIAALFVFEKRMVYVQGGDAVFGLIVEVVGLFVASGEQEQPD